MTAITEKELQEWTALCVDPWNGSHLRGDLSRVTCTAMPRLIEEVTELREENKQLREEVERLREEIENLRSILNAALHQQTTEEEGD